MTKAKRATSDAPAARVSRGRTLNDASFPAPPPRAGLPVSYAAVLGEIKQRIGTERLNAVMAANSAMVLLYWDIGCLILDRQQQEGWGAKVIDRLSADLREAFPAVRRPRMSLLREFHQFCSPLFQQIHALSLQNLRLRAARDLLLPRLMSGEIAA